MISDIDKIKFRRLDGGLVLVFHELLEHGSVTKTALSLSLGQSTISHSLSRLRDIFSDPLFIRRPHGLEPTQKALQLRPKIEELIDLTSATLGLGQSFDPSQSTRMFRISAPEFVTVVSGVNLLGRIEQTAPHVGLSFTQLSAVDVYEQLRRGELDIGIGRFEQPSQDVEVSQLYTDDFCIACRKGHPISKGRMTKRKYKAHAHIWANSESETTRQDSSVDFSGHRGSIVSTWLPALVIAAQSDLIATCPRRLAESHAELLKLDILVLPQYSGSIDVGLAHRRDLSDKGTQWLLDEVRQTFSMAS